MQIIEDIILLIIRSRTHTQKVWDRKQRKEYLAEMGGRIQIVGCRYHGVIHDHKPALHLT